MIGINLTAKDSLKKIEEKVEKKIKELVDQLKAQHSKFEDKDFGPTAADEYGAVSFYGNGTPDPAGSKYPDPATLRWERPQYADNKFDEPAKAKPAGDEEDGEEDNEDEEDDEEEDEDDYGISLSNNDSKVPYSSAFLPALIRRRFGASVASYSWTAPHLGM